MGHPFLTLQRSTNHPLDNRSSACSAFVLRSRQSELDGKTYTPHESAIPKLLIR